MTTEAVIENFETPKVKASLELWLTVWERVSASGTLGPGLWTAQKITEAIEGSAVQLRGLNQGGGLGALLLYREFEQVMEVDFLASLPQCRQQGLMTRLVLETFQASAAVELWLEAHENNANALAFYQKIGMVQSGERKAYYPDGGRALLWSLKKP